VSRVQDEGRSSLHRDAVVEAAVRVLADRGVAGLSDHAVDAECALPAGTTRTFFPDLPSLVTAIVDDLIRRDGEIWTSLGSLTPTSVADFADRIAGWVERALADLVGARARIQLFLGAPERAAAGHAAILEVLVVVLDVLRVPQPHDRGRLVVDLVSGTVLHHGSVRRSEPFDPPTFAAGVRRLLAAR